MIARELKSEPIQIVHIRSEEEYFEFLSELQCGCVLVEVFENPMKELNAIASICSRQKNIQVIAFGEKWEVANAVSAMKLGAKEVCEIPLQIDQLKNAIYSALKETAQVSLIHHDSIPQQILKKLTLEEATILRQILQGQSAKEVGASLDVSIRTFHYRKKTIFAKLGVSSRSEVIESIRRTSECNSESNLD